MTMRIKTQYEEAKEKVVFLQSENEKLLESKEKLKKNHTHTVMNLKKELLSKNNQY